MLPPKGGFFDEIPDIAVVKIFVFFSGLE